jgi:hypothetical protein
LNIAAQAITTLDQVEEVRTALSRIAKAIDARAAELEGIDDLEAQCVSVGADDSFGDAV